MDKVLVTSPLMPPLNELVPYLEDIWNRKWLTNNGYYHQELEKALAKYLDIKYISLFTNGTMALVTALQALRITGEVITTPYSFVASTHALWWNNIKPVFIDIERDSCNINPDKIEAAITPKTSAILPVHVYGRPCNYARIQQIADVYNLKVIYDAAHAFGVKHNNISVLNWGDLSILSFHATKTYNTIEGGAIICHDEKMKHHIDDLKNFGFRDEVTVVAPGINAKMNELQSAYGLISLKYIDSAIAKRKEVASIYRKNLKHIKGVRFLFDLDGVQHNYSYFPVFIDASEYGMSRDALYEKFRENDVYCRRYFYPLISNFPIYKGLPSAKVENLIEANKIANEVICLPLHHLLTEDNISRILQVISKK